VISVLQSSIIEQLGRKVLLRGGCWIMGSLLAGITVTLSLQVKKLFSWQISLSILLITSAHRQAHAAEKGK